MMEVRFRVVLMAKSSNFLVLQESITRSVYLYAQLRIRVVSQSFCVDQLNPGPRDSMYLMSL